ncbi:MAG: PQQ-dependent sugar dehydrogenase [Patescibacteria group bacterium]
MINKIKRKKIFAATIALIVGTGIGYFVYTQKPRDRKKNGATPKTTNNRKDVEKNKPTSDKLADIKVVAENLNIPWEVAFLPNNDLLVTERSGTLLKIANQQTKIPIEGVAHRGEGGLLGLALHPNFSENNLIYLYLTTDTSAKLTNRVEQYRLEGDSVTKTKTIIEDIPGAMYHDGGRMSVGSDNKLYITTGDAGNKPLAQDINSLAGKILRLNLDGTVPENNPFGNPVWTYGHRNPQGLAWDNEGNLWSTEHGPSGSQSGEDEINLIEKRQNYGWPIIKGDQTKNGMVTPVIQSGKDTTWAPAGAAIVKGNLIYAGLRGSSLYKATLDGKKVTSLNAYLTNEFGRLRAVVKGPDSFLYITTSNTDGRGDPDPTDDKIIRINPQILK